MVKFINLGNQDGNTQQIQLDSPQNINSNQEVRYVCSDIDGDTLKLLDYLIRIEILELNQEVYAKIKNQYQIILDKKANSFLPADEYKQYIEYIAEFTEAINLSKIIHKNYKVVLVFTGYLLTGKNGLAFLTLLLLDKIIEHSINHDDSLEIRIAASYNDFYALKLIEALFIDDMLLVSSKEMTPYFKSRDFFKATRNVSILINALYHYKLALNIVVCLPDTDNNGEKTLVLCSHAPMSIKDITNLANYLGSDKSISDIEQLVYAINLVFNDMLFNVGKNDLLNLHPKKLALENEIMQCKLVTEREINKHIRLHNKKRALENKIMQCKLVTEGEIDKHKKLLGDPILKDKSSIDKMTYLDSIICVFCNTKITNSNIQQQLDIYPDAIKICNLVAVSSNQETEDFYNLIDLCKIQSMAISDGNKTRNLMVGKRTALYDNIFDNGLMNKCLNPNELKIIKSCLPYQQKPIIVASWSKISYIEFLLKDRTSYNENYQAFIDHISNLKPLAKFFKLTIYFEANLKELLDQVFKKALPYIIHKDVIQGILRSYDKQTNDLQNISSYIKELYSALEQIRSKQAKSCIEQYLSLYKDTIKTDVLYLDNNLLKITQHFKSSNCDTDNQTDAVKAINQLLEDTINQIKKSITGCDTRITDRETNKAKFEEGLNDIKEFFKWVYDDHFLLLKDAIFIKKLDNTTIDKINFFIIKITTYANILHYEGISSIGVELHNYRIDNLKNKDPGKLKNTLSFLQETFTKSLNSSMDIYYTGQYLVSLFTNAYFKDMRRNEWLLAECEINLILKHICWILKSKNSLKRIVFPDYIIHAIKQKIQLSPSSLKIIELDEHSLLKIQYILNYFSNFYEDNDYVLQMLGNLMPIFQGDSIIFNKKLIELANILEKLYITHILFGDCIENSKEKFIKLVFKKTLAEIEAAYNLILKDGNMDRTVYVLINKICELVNVDGQEAQITEILTSYFKCVNNYVTYRRMLKPDCKVHKFYEFSLNRNSIENDCNLSAFFLSQSTYYKSKIEKLHDELYPEIMSNYEFIKSKVKKLGMVPPLYIFIIRYTDISNILENVENFLLFKETIKLSKDLTAGLQGDQLQTWCDWFVEINKTKERDIKIFHKKLMMHIAQYKLEEVAPTVSLKLK